MSTTPALVLQTQDNCPPGLLTDWAVRRGFELDVVRVDRWTALPDPTEYGFGVALGSYASLAGTRAGWMQREIEWIQRADAACVPVLGICFGAQALAVALGGSVRRMARPEFEWIELDTFDSDRIPAGPWLALHEDSIALPPLAYELARNRAGSQAFTLDRHLGVQFHPEATGALISRWISDRRDSLPRPAAELLARVHERGGAAAAAAIRLFDAFAAQACIGVGARELAT